MKIYVLALSGFYWNTANIRVHEYNRYRKQKTKGRNIQVLMRYKFRKIGNPLGNTVLQEKREKEERGKKNAEILLLNEVL